MNTNANIESERHDIDGKGRTLGELFFQRRYAIDTYQREYKWQTKQLVELIDDLSGKFLEYYEPGHDRDAVAKYGHYLIAGTRFIRDDDDPFAARATRSSTTDGYENFHSFQSVD
jgi:hypothetical protein